MFERLSLNSLKFFYFVGKYGSVTIAAQKLFVTQSAVSKQIYNLEESLGLCLFERKNKTLNLSTQGILLFNCCHKMFADLDDCLSQLKTQDNQNERLILSCEPTLAIKWLIPRLIKFKKLGHPFEIVLLTSGGKVNFEQHNIDIAIRRNDFYWGEHIFSEKIADEYICIVQNQQHSQNQDLLISTSRPHFKKHLKQFKATRTILDSRPHIELEHFYLCLEGCLAGLGSTIISMYMIEKELESQLLKTLISPFKDSSAYYLLSQQCIFDDAKKVIFLQWLQDEMQISQLHFLP